jgi:uncharacterized protein (DUF1697 family)
MTWVALLRGINLGRHKRIAMADLRQLLEALGYADVRTLLQSGNAVFTADPPGGAAELEQQIRDRIQADLGMDVQVLVRSAEELAAVADANPFVAQGVEPKELHLAFLSAPPRAELQTGIDGESYAPDELAFGDRAIYLRRPNGIQGTKLPDFQRLLGVEVTERNWNTVTKLRTLAAEPS